MLVSNSAREAATKFVKEQRLVDSQVKVILEELGISEQVALFCEMKFKEIRDTNNPDKIEAVSEIIQKFCQEVSERVRPFIESDGISPHINIIGNDLTVLSMNPGIKLVNIEAQNRRRGSEESLSKWRNVPTSI